MRIKLWKLSLKNKKTSNYKFIRNTVYGELFEFEKNIYMKVNEFGEAVELSCGKITCFDMDNKVRIIENYNFEVFD